MKFNRLAPTHAQHARALKRELMPDPYTGIAIQWGVVSVIHTGPPVNVDVFIDGSATLTKGLKIAGWYYPITNDYVLIVRQGSDRIVLGTLGGTVLGTPAVGCRVHMAGSQADTNGVATLLAMTGVDYDLGSNYNTGNSIFTCPTAGIYRVDAGVVSPVFTIGDRYIWVYKNGAAYQKIGALNEAATGGNPIIGGSTTVQCSTGDTLKFFVLSPGTTAGALNNGWADISLR